jgi:hypothetical protein
MNPVLGESTADHRALPAWVECRPTDKMTVVSPSGRETPLILPYTLASDLANEVKRRR